MKFLITTRYGMREFSYFEYMYDNRLDNFYLNFYNDTQKVLILEFKTESLLKNVIKSLYYTISNSKSYILLIDSDKLFDVNGEKEYLGYGIDP